MAGRDWLPRLVHRSVRSYTRYSPIRKGKYRLVQKVRNTFPSYTEPLIASSRDGRNFKLNLSTGMYDTLYFLGEYESFLTHLIGRLVHKGDICIDAGANFGWYTTYMADLVGKTGYIHAFEPVPDTFAELACNTKLNGKPTNVILNNAALSDRESVAFITLFDGQPSGHASLARKGAGTRIECSTTSLDNYLFENGIADIAFVKVDIEGAELDFLRGAERLFQQPDPPLMIMEMALEQSMPFGYLPNDLVEHIRSRAAYDFFKIDEVGGRLIQIDSIGPDDIGANMLCVPVARASKIRGELQDLIVPRSAHAG